MRSASPGSSASCDSGRPNLADSRPAQASASARRHWRSVSSGETAAGNCSACTRSASTVCRRASADPVSYSSSARPVVHFSACGSSVSWARVISMTSPSPPSTRSSSVITGPVPRPRCTNTIRPSISAASKANMRDSEPMVCFGDSRLASMKPSTAPVRRDASIWASASPARRQRCRTSARSDTLPRRPFSQWPSRQLSPSDQISPSAG